MRTLVRGVDVGNHRKAEREDNILNSIGSNSANPGQIVAMRLEIPYESFDLDAEKKFRELASELVGCALEDVRIIEKRPGCTYVRIYFPSRVAAKEFVKMLEEGRKKLAKEIIIEYAPSQVILELELDEGFIQNPPVVIRRSNKLTFSWLHFSDAHITGEIGKEGLAWNQDVVINRFSKWIKDDIKRTCSDIGAVFFTGDLAAKAQEYDYTTALNFFTSIRSALENRTPIFVVPGNHDVNWNALSEKEEQVIENVTTLEDATNLLLDTNSDIPIKIKERFSLYTKFEENQLWLNSNIKDKIGEPITYFRPGNIGGREPLWYVSKIKIDPTFQVGIAAINSAIFSLSKKKHDKTDVERLILSEVQLDSINESLKSCNFKIAILHHPIDSSWYLREDRQRQREFIKDFDFVLNGHEHDLNDIFRSSSDNPLGVTNIAAGAIYESRHHANSFNIVLLDFQEMNGTISAWRFAEKRRKWVIDVDQFDNGTADIKLDKGILLRGHSN